MSLSIERDNAVEEDAVIVYWGRQLVGYVRSGADRECALSIIRTSGRGGMLGRVVDIDRRNRWLWVEVECGEEIVSTEHEEKVSVLSDWSFSDRVLSVDEEEVRLHTMLRNLEMVLECQEPWDEDMTEWLDYISENLWRDISSETTAAVRHILDLLTVGSATHEEYASAAHRLQFCIDFMGSKEVRKLQARQILDKAHSRQMDVLLQYYGDHAEDAIRQLPQELVTLFHNDGELFMGRLWYLHRPYQQVQAIKTLLAMMVRLKDNDGKDASDAIPRQWLINYGIRSENERKADLIEQIITAYELERSQPDLSRALDEMHEICKPQKKLVDNVIKQTEVMKSSAEALHDVASRHTYQITPQEGSTVNMCCEMNNCASGIVGSCHSQTTDDDAAEDASMEDDETRQYARTNIIFNTRMFQKEKHYARLHECILRFVRTGGEQDDAEYQIEATSKSEWYYIMKALKEADVVSHHNFSLTRFVEQMQAWYPRLFEIDAADDGDKTSVRRYMNAVSRESQKWVAGMDKHEVAIRDMFAHQQMMHYDQAKTLRLHGVAAGLKKALAALQQTA